MTVSDLVLQLLPVLRVSGLSKSSGKLVIGWKDKTFHNSFPFVSRYRTPTYTPDYLQTSAG